MKITEREPLRLYCDATNSSYGLIKLTHLAKPETMEITLQGETLIPEKFNIYGEPIFSEEMTMLYEWKQNQLRRNPETKDVLLKAEISYETQELTIPISMVDSCACIQYSLSNLNTFKELLNNRRICMKSLRENEYLNEFVVFGRYKLDQFAQVWEIHNFASLPKVPDVCTLNFFNQQVRSYSSSPVQCLPVENSTCPCCGKKFTIEDLRNTEFGLINGKISHDSCRRNYYHHREIDKFSRRLVDLVYDEEPKFDLLPNGYCHNECCTHIPWFLFHTSDGDIEIGWRKRVISIEWQENFKPFDMAIFNDENVTKWCYSSDIYNIYNPVEEGSIPTNGKRGIHAWGEEKALEYLRKVKKLVNSTKN